MFFIRQAALSKSVSCILRVSYKSECFSYFDRIGEVALATSSLLIWAIWYG